MNDNIQLKQLNDCESIRSLYVTVYGFIISLVFFLMHLLSMTSLAYFGCLLIAFTLILFSEKEHFLLITFLIPNLFMFKFLESNSAILGYFFMVVCLKYLYKNFFFLKVNPYLFACFGACLLTSLYWGDLSLFLTCFRFSLNLFLFFSLGQLLKKREFDTVLIVFMIGCLVSIVFALLFWGSKGLLYNGMFTWINNDRNYAAAMLSPIFSIMCLFFMERQTNFKTNVFFAITLLICVVDLLLAASRTAAMSLLLSLLLLISYFFNSKLDARLIKRLIIISIFFLCMFFYLINQYADSINFFINRFESEDFEGGNGRFDLWLYYYQRFTDNVVPFLIGNGAIYEKGLLAEHNSIIQSVNQIGLIGSITLFLLFSSFFSSSIKSIKNVSWKSFLPLLVVVFCFSGVSALFSDQLSFLFVLSLLIIKFFSKSENVIVMLNRCNHESDSN